MENEQASLLVISLGKELNGNPPFPLGKHVAGPSILTEDLLAEHEFLRSVCAHFCTMLSTIALTTTVALKTVCSARREYVSKQSTRRRLYHEANLFCTFQLQTICAARSLATLSFSTTSGPGLGKFPGFWGFVVLHDTPILRKGMNNLLTVSAHSSGAIHSVTSLDCVASKRSLLNSLHESTNGIK